MGAWRVEQQEKEAKEAEQTAANKAVVVHNGTCVCVGGWMCGWVCVCVGAICCLFKCLPRRTFPSESPARSRESPHTLSRTHRHSLIIELACITCTVTLPISLSHSLTHALTHTHTQAPTTRRTLPSESPARSRERRTTRCDRSRRSSPPRENPQRPPSKVPFFPFRYFSRETRPGLPGFAFRDFLF